MKSKKGESRRWPGENAAECIDSETRHRDYREGSGKSVMGVVMVPTSDRKDKHLQTVMVEIPSGHVETPSKEGHPSPT